MLGMNGIESLYNESNVEREAPKYSGPVEIVLIHAGFNLQAISDVLRDVMGLCLPDAAAIDDALPLILYEELPLSEAETLCQQLALAGGIVDIHPSREKYMGVRKSLRPRTDA